MFKCDANTDTERIDSVGALVLGACVTGVMLGAAVAGCIVVGVSVGITDVGVIVG